MTNLERVAFAELTMGGMGGRGRGPGPRIGRDRNGLSTKIKSRMKQTSWDGRLWNMPGLVENTILLFRKTC